LNEANGDGRIQIDSYLTRAHERSLARDVRSGLSRPVKQLPPKHFYDRRGSELFERICELPEYYLTRSEREILSHRAGEIVAATDVGDLVELGSGSAEKARILLDAMREAGTLRRYVPVDVSEQALRSAADELVSRYEGLTVHGVVADFERQLDRLPSGNGDRRVVALLGSTIGNFRPRSRRALLARVRGLLAPGDRLLLGADLVKDPATLEAAYNDSQGVTAEFNRNVLHVINRELDADFDPAQFDHVAFFDFRNEWMDMRLRARKAMTVEIKQLDLEVGFAFHEELHTEISAKFTQKRLEEDLAAAGLALEEWFTDRQARFVLLVAAPI
jgi:L-histidine N-alpha-methyltransferase